MTVRATRDFIGRRVVLMEYVLVIILAVNNEINLKKREKVIDNGTEYFLKSSQSEEMDYSYQFFFL